MATIASMLPHTWWRADSIVGLSDGDSVTAWPDDSGNGWTATRTGGTSKWETAESPTGKPVVRVPGTATSDVLTSSAPATGATGQTYLAAVKPSGSAGVRTIVGCSGGGTTSGNQVRLENSTNRVQLMRQGSTDLATSSLALVAGSWSIVAVTYNASTGAWEIRVDGASTSGTAAASSFTGSTTRRVAGGNSEGERWIGDLGEIVTFERILSPSELADAEAELAARWIGAASIDFAGTVAAVSGIEGAISAKVALSGTVAAVSGVEGAFESSGTVHPFTGQVDALSGVEGALTARVALAGQVDAVSGVQGSLSLAADGQDLVSGFRFGSSLTSGVVSLQHIESGFRFGSRLKQSRDWGVPAGSTRPSPLVVITQRDGTPVTVFGEDDRDGVSISPQDSGVGVMDGWRFSVDRDNARGKLIDPVTHEAHLYRGTYLMTKGPIGPGRLENGRMVYDVSDPRWYLSTGRRIGRLPSLNWAYNGDFALGTAGWTGAYKTGSVPEAKPEFYVVDEPESTSGKGLRIEGVDKVVTTRKDVETAAVFVANEATYLSGGEALLISQADDIPDGSDIHIVGHTADRRAYGDEGDGIELSLARAQAARATLAAHNPSWTFSLLPDWFSIPSYKRDQDSTVGGRGYWEQIASNSTESESAKNRRVALHYATTQTATGHRQYVAQRRYNVVQEVDMLVPLEVIVVGRMRIGEWLGAPADGNAMRVVLVDLETGAIAIDPETGSPVESTVTMSAITPRVKVQTYEASIKVPADGRTYYISVELYPPAGWSVWSDIQILPQEQRGYFDMDQALIVRDLTLHVQDTNYGHGDLGIGTRTPRTGVLRTKEYPFAQRWPWSTAIEGLTSLARGVEVDCEVTATSATIVTHYPRQGTVSGLSLSHGGPKSIIKAYRPIPGERSKLASSLIVQAWGYNSSRIERHVRDESAFGGALLEEVVEAEEESSPNELAELAAQHLARSVHPTAAWEVVIDPARTSEVLDEIGKGDRVLLSLPDEGVHSLHRMVLRTWDPETDTLTLQLAPEEV